MYCFNYIRKYIDLCGSRNLYSFIYQVMIVVSYIIVYRYFPLCKRMCVLIWKNWVTYYRLQNQLTTIKYSFISERIQFHINDSLCSDIVIKLLILFILFTYDKWAYKSLNYFKYQEQKHNSCFVLFTSFRLVHLSWFLYDIGCMTTRQFKKNDSVFHVL